MLRRTRQLRRLIGLVLAHRCNTAYHNVGARGLRSTARPARAPPQWLQTSVAEPHAGTPRLRWALMFSFGLFGAMEEEKQQENVLNAAKQEDTLREPTRGDSREPAAEKEASEDEDLEDIVISTEAPTDPAFTSFEHSVPDFGEAKWEQVYADGQCTVQRRWRATLETYEYRCCGSYSDISARDFVEAQMDNRYRKKWDPHVIDLEVIETEDDGAEIVRWLHRFPRPLNPRVYIYRRQRTWETSKVLRVESKVLAEHERPTSADDQQYVRVERYSSTLRVRPHHHYYDKGLDYVLVYYDHPKAVIPGPAYNWMVSKGGPYFLGYVHDAAKRLSAEHIREERMAQQRQPCPPPKPKTKPPEPTTTSSSPPKPTETTVP